MFSHSLIDSMYRLVIRDWGWDCEQIVDGDGFIGGICGNFIISFEIFEFFLLGSSQSLEQF